MMNNNKTNNRGGGGGDNNNRATKNNSNNAFATKNSIGKSNPMSTKANQHSADNNSSSRANSINSSNSGGASVKFAPAVMMTAACGVGEPQMSSYHMSTSMPPNNNKRNGGSQSLAAGNNSLSSGSLSTMSGGSKSLLKRPTPSHSTKEQQTKTAQQQKQTNYSQSSETSNLTTNSTRENNNNSSSSGSGSDNNGGGSGSGGGGTTSSSNNAAVVTTGNTTSTTGNNNNTTSSGSGEDGSGSGSGSGTTNSRHNRSAGEVSGDYYYAAGYGSTATASSNQAAGKSVSNMAAQSQTTQQDEATQAAMGMPSFANYQGATLAAAAQAAAAGPQAPQGVAPRSMNSTTRHVVVGTNEGGLPPPPHAFNASSSQLRHHTSRHRRNAPQDAAAMRREAAAPTDGMHAASRGMPLNGGIPSAIDGPTAAHRFLPPPIHQQRYNRSSSHHAQQIHELRLPPSDEQAVLQRVPRTHATVVAHDLPPPPTSSDAWSSTSSGAGSSSRSRKRQTAGVSGSASKHTSTAHSTKNKNSASKKPQDQYPMVASVRLSNGGTVDSVNMSDASPSSSDSSTQVMEGRRKSSAAAMHVTMDDPILRRKMVPGSSSNGTASGPANKSKTDLANKNMKRKLSAMSGDNADDSSDSAKSNEAEAAGSGSDEGYNASSERQSGSGSGSGSDDGDSSEGDGNKKLSARGGGGGGSDNQVGVTVGRSQFHSKRTETSSMSSSVLADFSSGMNEVGSRSDSPSQSSLSSNGGNDMDQDLNKCGTTPVDKADETHLSDAAVRSKRYAAYLSGTTSGRKRSKSEDLDVKPSALKRFSQSTKHPMISGLSIMEKSLQQKLRSTNHHHYHSQSTGRKMLEKSFLSAKRDLSEADAVMKLTDGKHIQARLKDDDEDKEASIFSLGQDIMAQVVSYLDPPEAHSFLTTPLSKAWLVTYTAPQELWKILCTSKPFYAKLDGEDGSSDSSCSFPICNDLQMRQLFGKYRLLYTSFVRCMKYLNRLQDDAINGRTPSVYTTSNRADIYPFNKNSSLKSYFAKARRDKPNGCGSRSSSDAALSITSPDSGSTAGKGTEKAASSKKQKSTRRLGRSMLTDRLLRPTQGGAVGNVNLPWSCAIYSVVNWMVAFADVEGIQIMCLKCLPYLLEDESQRTTAQRAGLTDSVLRAMVLFPDSIELHTVAFHTLVLLARPLGGNEGMLFHTAMVNTRGIFNNGSSNSKNGIVIMLDSMRRFAQDEILQAMSCWSLVNVALTPLQKSMLVKLGGLTVTSNAMLQHPYNAEVQFRALFALINLVIPTETRPDETEEMREFEREIFQQLGEVGETSEKEMLDANVGQISNLVVASMKNFCSSEAILNRACLVLHNLSLNEEYHSILLWTPNCYQMLEWCLGNYPHDHVLQQSAGGTIQRLNATLSADEDLRARFTHSIRAQQQHSLDIARQEAVNLQEQQEQQMDVS